MRSGVTSGECVASQVHATPYARAISSDRARQAKSPGKHAVDAHNPRALRSVGCAASAKSQSVSGLKRASQVKDVLIQDYKQGQYLVTGNLTEAMYTKFCRVSDPTGVIWGIGLYQTIIARLFDPEQSSIKLKSITVEGPSSIVATWTKEGFLQLPWRPYLPSQEGKTYYTLDTTGLICVHKQTWDNMTALQAIKIALTPTSGKKP